MRWLTSFAQIVCRYWPGRALIPVATVVAWVPAISSAHATVVTESFVEAVAQIESSGGHYLVGDGGKANGRWQMHQAAWQDTTAFRRRQGLPVWTYAHVCNPEIARIYARDYLTILEKQISKVAGPGVTAELVYAAYNVGFSRLQSLGFRIQKTPPSTRRACARLPQLIATPVSPSKHTLTIAKAR